MFHVGAFRLARFAGTGRAFWHTRRLCMQLSVPFIVRPYCTPFVATNQVDRQVDMKKYVALLYPFGVQCRQEGTRWI